MGYCDLHTHTTFCDGKSTPREMVLSAIDKGITTLGLLAHSYVDFDRNYAIDPARVEDFRAEVANLKEEFKDKIEILFGIEADYYASEIYGGTDYIIGSVHYLKFEDGFRSVDMSREELLRVVNEKFDGDFYAMCEEYYRLVADVVAKLRADIVGHFDIVTKFNEDDVLFDTKNERYIKAWQAAADRLIADGATFEINTGAIARGKRTTPYPAQDIIDYLKKRGARLVLSSDSHRAQTLAYDFDKYSHLIK